MENRNPQFYDWLSPWYEAAYEWLDTNQTVRQWVELIRSVAPHSIPEIGCRPRLLDAGCGPASHATAWAKAGYEVTGVDISPGMLQQAALRVAATGTAVDLIQADLRSWRGNKRFDVIVCHTYFAHLFPAPELLDVARTMRAVASENGVWIQEFGDLSRRGVDGTRRVTKGVLAGMTIEAKKCAKDGTYHQHWAFQGARNTEVFWFHGSDALKQLLREAGWKQTSVWFCGPKAQNAVWKKRRTGSSRRGVLVSTAA